MKTSILFLLCVSLAYQVMAQDLILPGKGLRPYQYQGNKIKKSEIVDLVYASNDAIAIRHIKNYRGWKTVSWTTFTAGTALFFVGSYIHVSQYLFQQDQSPIQKYNTAGTVLYCISIVADIGKFSSFNNAINRFNEVQQATRLDLGIGPKGVGLTWRF